MVPERLQPPETVVQHVGHELERHVAHEVGLREDVAQVFPGPVPDPRVLRHVRGVVPAHEGEVERLEVDEKRHGRDGRTRGQPTCPGKGSVADRQPAPKGRGPLGLGILLRAALFSIRGRHRAGAYLGSSSRSWPPRRVRKPRGPSKDLLTPPLQKAHTLPQAPSESPRMTLPRCAEGARRGYTSLTSATRTGSSLKRATTGHACSAGGTHAFTSPGLRRFSASLGTRNSAPLTQRGIGQPRRRSPGLGPARAPRLGGERPGDRGVACLVRFRASQRGRKRRVRSHDPERRRRHAHHFRRDAQRPRFFGDGGIALDSGRRVHDAFEHVHALGQRSPVGQRHDRERRQQRQLSGSPARRRQ